MAAPFRALSGRRMVGPDGLEPSTPRLSSACSNQLSYEPREMAFDPMGTPPPSPTLWRASLAFQVDGSAIRSSGGAKDGGADEIRTRDPLLAKQVLYQLSYDPKK